LKSLNREQKKAVSFTTGIAAVIAVPGSGKTFQLVERIGFLVTRHNVSPEKYTWINIYKKTRQKR